MVSTLTDASGIMYDIFNAGVIDLAFLFSDNFSEKLLHVEELAKVELAFVVSPNDDEFNNRAIAISDFHDKTLLLSKSDCSYRMIFEKMLIEANIKLKRTFEVNNPETLKKMLVAGCMGIGLLPEIAVDKELSDGTLKSLKWKGPTMNIKLYMIWKKDKYQTEATKAFIQAVRDFFKKG